MTDTGRIDVLKRQPLGVKLAVIIGALLVLGLLLLGSVSALGTFFFYDSYSSSYHYEGSVYVQGETEDAVFVLPVGIYDDEAVVDEIDFAQSDRFEGIEYEVIETEHGPMVRIEVDEISDGRDSLWFDARMDSDRTIDTRQPRETEPVLSPIELTEPEFDDDAPLHDRGPHYRSFDATSSAYVEHDGPADVEVGFMVSYEGANEWWSFGWNGNTYETTVVANQAAHDPDGAWVELRGWHTEGAGSYPRFPPAPS